MLPFCKMPENSFSVESAQMVSYEELVEEHQRIKQGNEPSLFVAEYGTYTISSIRKATKREIKQAINDVHKTSSRNH